MPLHHLNEVFPYFNPAGIIKPAHAAIALSSNLGSSIQHYSIQNDQSVTDANLVILGAPNDPIADQIRSHLFAMGPMDGLDQVLDLGNFRPGKTKKDSQQGWKDVLFELGKLQKTIVILGGRTEELETQIEAFSLLEHPVGLTVISPDLHLSSSPDELQATYLNRVLLDPENRLFGFTQMAYQNYFTDPAALELIENLHFNHIRLGELRGDIREMEPYLRDADMIAFSIAAIRSSDAPGNRLDSPNGLYAEEACQLARYAGLSDKVMSFTLNDFIKTQKTHPSSLSLSAQIIWHFIQGVSQRKADYPFSPIQAYQKFIVNIPGIDHDIRFYKSPKTERWWLEVPYPDPKYPRSVFVACTVQDYQKASNGEIPERWLRTYQRIC